MTLPEYEEIMDDDRISEIENNLLQGILGCRTTEAVEAAVTYAKFLSSVGITPDNYPLFLKMLEIENHWVIDALVANRDPFLMLSPVQPNKFIVNKIFAMLTKWRKGGIYSTNLSVILGVIQTVYSSPTNGYRIYPLSIADLNALGKHLNKEHGQDDPLNRVILDILENLSDLEGKEDSEMEEIAIHLGDGFTATEITTDFHNTACLENDSVTLWVTDGHYGQKGKMRIRGDYPRNHRGEFVDLWDEKDEDDSMNCSNTKTGEKIAKDITKRILSAVEVNTRNTVKIIDSLNVDKNNLKTVKQFYKDLGCNRVKVDSDDSTISHYEYDKSSFDISLNHDGSGFYKMEIGTCSMELLEKITKMLIKEGQNA